MEELFEFLFGASGRISRAKYWRSVVLFGVARLLTAVVAQPACKSSMVWECNRHGAGFRPRAGRFGAYDLGPSSKSAACAAPPDRTNMVPTRPRRPNGGVERPVQKRKKPGGR
jgi:hypothetical protein